MEQQLSLKILYEDADIIVCVKPAGTATQTKKTGQQDMLSLLRNYRHRKGEDVYVGLVHRLDQPVEGILVFGKHAQSTAELNRQLGKGGFIKEYLSVTQGEMPEKHGKLQDFLRKDGRSNTSYVTSEDDKQAKRAELLYEVLETDRTGIPVLNLVKIRLLTGRHHQIRVQMAHLGTPLAGDTKYGSSSQIGHPHQMAGGLGLCACKLEFQHPVTKKLMNFKVAPSQPVFQKFGRCSKK